MTVSCEEYVLDYYLTSFAVRSTCDRKRKLILVVLSKVCSEAEGIIIMFKKKKIRRGWSESRVGMFTTREGQ